MRKLLPWHVACETVIGWMQGGGRGAAGAPLAMVAPSGKGAMLVDAESGHLQWLQPSGNTLLQGHHRAPQVNSQTIC